MAMGWRVETEGSGDESRRGPWKGEQFGSLSPCKAKRITKINLHKVMKGFLLYRINSESILFS